MTPILVKGHYSLGRSAASLRELHQKITTPTCGVVGREAVGIGGSGLPEFVPFFRLGRFVGSRLDRASVRRHRRAL
jgi:hypothetical protein